MERLKVICLTDKEILEHPNDYDLGGFVRKRFYDTYGETKTEQHFPVDDEHVFLDTSPDGTIKKLFREWKCSFCDEDTFNVDSDYLVGFDHLGCLIKNSKESEKDKCVMCGKETPYDITTNINLRVGYIEGGGQGCYQPNVCGK